MIAQPGYRSIPNPAPVPKFAANLHYLFSEVTFLDRFEAAARAGFKGVEFQVPYDPIRRPSLRRA
jgi:hydroxypyruvate isomerase